eukprot:3194754-Rhodomonas_salina.5
MGMERGREWRRFSVAESVFQDGAWETVFWGKGAAASVENNATSFQETLCLSLQRHAPKSTGTTMSAKRSTSSIFWTQNDQKKFHDITCRRPARTSQRYPEICVQTGWGEVMTTRVSGDRNHCH